MRIALLGNPDNLHVRRWVRFLASRGHELRLIVDPHTRARPNDCEVRVVEWSLLLNTLAFRLTPRPHGNALWKPWLYRPLIADFRPDVVHGFEAYYNGLATSAAGPFPRVLSPWGRDIFFDGRAGGLAGWMVRRALRDVERITCNDESIAPFLVETYGIPREKVVPFSWGIDLEVFSEVDARKAGRMREELGIEPEAPVILSPRKWGRLWGSDAIGAALPEVLKASPHAVAVLMAPALENPEALGLKAGLESACDSRRLRWLEPDQSSESMATLFSLADVFVSAPPADLLAQTVLEGMACGCFPVLSRLEAYAKHAVDRKTALLVDPADPAALAAALIEALQNNSLREEAARLNRDAMRRSEDASVNMLKMEEVYAQAIEIHGRMP